MTAENNSLTLGKIIFTYKLDWMDTQSIKRKSGIDSSPIYGSEIEVKLLKGSGWENLTPSMGSA